MDETELLKRNIDAVDRYLKTSGWNYKFNEETNRFMVDGIVLMPDEIRLVLLINIDESEIELITCPERRVSEDAAPITNNSIAALAKALTFDIKKKSSIRGVFSFTQQVGIFAYMQTLPCGNGRNPEKVFAEGFCNAVAAAKEYFPKYLKLLNS
jgi:hypothetical protein